MYRIKAKVGYNVILKDIGVNLKSENDKWIEVPKELLDNSKDARALAAFFNKEDISVKEDTKEDKTNAVKPKEEAFVAHKSEEKQPEGIFIAQPKGEEVEQISEAKKGAKVLDEVQVEEIPVVEEKAEPIVANKEVKVEAKEVKTKEAKAEKAKATTKTKKATNKK